MDAPRPITPPGWYDDGHGQLRWYDGSQWTQHTAPLAQAGPPRVPQQPVAPPRPQVRREDLVPVKRSKLVWILPIVFVIAALVGALSAVAAWNAGGFDPDPLEQTYADFVRAEASQDCAALEAVTTTDFRDDLFDPAPYTCESFTSGPPPTPRNGEPVWGLRLGSTGFLLVDEEFVNDPTTTTFTSYTLVRENGQWKLDEFD